MTNTLQLTIAEPWFSMIREGKKKEEYREIKPYYESRFYKTFISGFGTCEPEAGHRFKDFANLVLRNGYRADSPKLTLRNPKIKIGKGRPEWGAEPEKLYFVITWEV